MNCVKFGFIDYVLIVNFDLLKCVYDVGVEKGF